MPPAGVIASPVRGKDITDYPEFVFVEDGINVEDTAIFEGTHMIAHVFVVPD